MKIRPNRGLGILLALVLIALAVLASSGSDEPVTGPTAPMEIFEQRGDSVAAYPNNAPGYYDQQGDYEYSGRRGSGSQHRDGSWNQYSGAAGGAVGGTSDGCTYTSFGWSNC